jgi:anti-sigma-K factor RskA
MNKPVRHVRAGDLPPVDVPPHVDDCLRQTTPVLHRIDVDQLPPGGIYFAEPPEHVSTPESRNERARFWRWVVLPTAIVTASVIAALVIVFVK